MSKRVCTTQSGESVCCVAASRGLLGRPITFTTRSGARRCGECNVVPSQSRSHPGKPVFQFRFHKSAECGIVGSGCAALAQLQNGGYSGVGGPSSFPLLSGPGQLALP